MECPSCAETIKDAAKICRYCGRDIPAGTAQKQQEEQARESLKGCGMFIVFVAALICFIYVMQGIMDSSEEELQSFPESEVHAPPGDGAERAPEEPPASATPLVGQCAYNRSDSRLLGRVIEVGPPGMATAGRTAEGQRVVTVRLTAELRAALGAATDEFTYPRNVTVERCR